MTCRATIAAFASLVLLGAQTVGLHWHGNVTHAPDAPGEHGHHGTLADLAVESASVHLDEHLVSGDHDLESELVAGGKVPLVQLFIALFIVLIVFAIVEPALRAQRPKPRPPRFRFNPFQLPPSHAPPHRA